MICCCLTWCFILLRWVVGCFAWSLCLYVFEFNSVAYYYIIRRVYNICLVFIWICIWFDSVVVAWVCLLCILLYGLLVVVCVYLVGVVWLLGVWVVYDVGLFVVFSVLYCLGYGCIVLMILLLLLGCGLGVVCFVFW